MTKDTALTLALEALESLQRSVEDDYWDKSYTNAISAISEALAAPQGEPVCWCDYEQWDFYKDKPQVDTIPLFEHPAPTPLSDTDIERIAKESGFSVENESIFANCEMSPTHVLCTCAVNRLCRAIERHVRGSHEDA